MKISINLVFYMFAILGILMALNVVVQNNPVRSVLSLVATFFCTAVLWMLCEAEFLSLILVLVYVGAVMTLFLFVVMMLNVDQEAKAKPWKIYIPVSLIFVAIIMSLVIHALPKVNQLSTHISISGNVISNTEALGLQIYTDYIIAFQIAAILLLIAMISAITLVHRGSRTKKIQNIRKQTQVDPKERISMINKKPSKLDVHGEK